MQFEKYNKPTFWEMLLHHIVTIFVMVGSFVNNQFVIGGFVLWIHDCSDLWLFCARIPGDFQK
jgi:ceramide synthetase